MKQGEYVFDIPTVVNSIGITTTDLSNQLQNLKVWMFKEVIFSYILAIGVKKKSIEFFMGGVRI